MRQLLLLPLIVALLSAGCGRSTPLAHAFPSSTMLAEALLDALARRDRARLDEIALDEAEFREHVWPELPAARPERNLPFSYVWGDLRQKSQTVLTETLSRHGGRQYRVLEVEFQGNTDYVTYRVHRDATLRVDDGSGEPSAVRVCGSMIEKNGAWKVFSYVID